MSEQRDTNIRRPDGIILKGEIAGHAKAQKDGSTVIRKRDGVLFRGDVVGEVGADSAIRKPPGIIFKGEQVGQVKGRTAHAPDGILLQGEKWGYVDDEGNVRLRDGILFKGRIIGKVKGDNVAGALGHFVLRFDRLKQQCQELEDAVERATSKAGFLDRARGMIKRVETAEALGDFDGLLRQLHELEHRIERDIDTHRTAKRRLCEEAETLRTSSDWKQGAETLHRLHEKWKQLASCGRACDDELWQRFQSAKQAFYDRRHEHFEALDRERGKSKARKAHLCARAESLAGSSDWKSAGDALKDLMMEWKRAGFAGMDAEDALWHRFRAAQDRFHRRREAHFDQRNREIEHNLAHLQRIASRAASLVGSSNHRAAVDRIKELQAEWKNIGFVPRERSQPVWDDFRANCDRVFAEAREAHERRQAEWRSGQHEALDRFRDKARNLQESIDHDLGLIEHWEDVISNLRGGARADEIESSMREKIDSVSTKVEAKRDRLREIEDIIDDIERRLRD